MDELFFTALLMMAVFMGYALGWCFGTTWQLKKLLPELNSLREEVGKLKLLARMKGVDLD
ncbi:MULTISPECIES: hypothetical protein [Pseudomonas]|uniref:Uncharacterized protein n=1 Tax=Pseudomonas taiwanensis SJ9 TaxID=1388762 RepID=V7DCW1_9PSED|nr:MULTISPECIES: hypothetical protein [Pseudomonas]ESW39325.1 hypothetical protein O164_12695 [Pseudomonas taiwanensis SJ9]BBV97931.1 hypothetical protein STW0522PSE72_32820 [Pseudomonas monteilii]